ncbi:protein MOS2-like isoform X2 [Magnolia sinica]|uniref:protein MOS2-like isoform X2 n=1 Tax=Magnolia sinica TaxID=86752 RepID=UPI002658426C|nr:protein MOS2-like isoform X2 [Magnolia sinica]XP_058105151.1 protein MOS2-like isoform X2 [Magnolia sinica]XP_058105152.1 protein MOS2-like isoform X2 [Magnolia sinica]
MKLSFSIPSKPKPSISSKPSNSFHQEKSDDPQSHREYLTEFDSSKTLAAPNPDIIIPPKPNTFNPLKKMRNLVPDSTADADLRFELEDPSIADPAAQSNVSYGLNLRSKEEITDKKPTDHIDSNAPNSVEDIVLQKYKADMENMPDDRGFAEFDDVPVEGFGTALLAGYGWKEGKGIGRNSKDDVKVVQYVRRAGTEGLGFVPEFHDTKRKRGDGRPPEPPLVAPKGPDGRTRHVVGIDEKLVPREPKGVFVGKVVRVVDGRHVGLKGKVVEMPGSDSESSKVVLKLSKSGEEVSVGLKQVAELGSVEEEKCLRRLQELKIHDKKNDERRDSLNCGYREKKDRRRVDESKRDDKVPKLSSRDSSGRREDDQAPFSWLTSHIRVRIISKDFKGGKLYLKKGEVMDVVGPTTCDISMDESRELIQGIEQEMLETALPKRGGPVLVLSGKHKGVYGTLMERDMEKEMGVIRDADSHALFKVRLEQIAEYVGDPSYIGY